MEVDEQEGRQRVGRERGEQGQEGGVPDRRQPKKEAAVGGSIVRASQECAHHDRDQNRFFVYVVPQHKGRQTRLEKTEKKTPRRRPFPHQHQGGDHAEKGKNGGKGRGDRRQDLGLDDLHEPAGPGRSGGRARAVEEGQVEAPRKGRQA